MHLVFLMVFDVFVVRADYFEARSANGFSSKEGYLLRCLLKELEGCS